MMQPVPMEAREGGIVDPSYLAQLAVLNQPQVASAQFQPMGSGLIDGSAGMGKGGGNLTVPNYRPMAQQFRQDLANIHNASAAAGGDGGQIAFNPNQDFGYFSGVTPSVNYGVPISDALVGTVNSDGSVSYSPIVSPVTDYGPVVGTPLGPLDGGGGGGGGFDGTSSGPFGGISEGFDGSPSAPSANVGAQEGFDGSPGDGGGGGGGKIICTAMNHAYGFGSFRNAIWIAYADKHLSKAHEVGYHALFLPLVDFGFKRGSGRLNLAVRKVLEWGTRHRSTDLRAEMRGTKRDTTGRVIRMIFEPLCYAVGKLKGY
jgi:hypothetical protein